MDYPDVNPIIPGPGWGFGIFWHIGSFIFGLALFAALVLVLVLLVRYLLVATRAHQHYLDSHRSSTASASAVASPAPAASPSSTPASDPTPPDVPPAAKPAPRTRTPKVPPDAAGG